MNALVEWNGELIDPSKSRPSSCYDQAEISRQTQQLRRALTLLLGLTQGAMWKKSKKNRRSASPQPLSYAPLGEKDIRLVRCFKGPVFHQLHLETFSIDKVPPYLALSYCWGSPDDLSILTVNQQEVVVRKNLVNALVHLFTMSEIF